MMLGVRTVGYRLRMQDVQKMFQRKIHRKHSFYESLGITPKATQADIKKAFYNLSMQFHPDKSTGNDVKFKEISAAYEVLGNLKLRRLYDRGMLPSGVASAHDMDIYDKETESEFSRQYPQNTEERRKREPMSGKTNMYDYDEWSRAHYADTFTRNDRNRSRWTSKRSHRIMETAQARSENLVWILGGLILSLMFYNASLQQNWDKPRKKRLQELQEAEED